MSLHSMFDLITQYHTDLILSYLKSCIKLNSKVKPVISILIYKQSELSQWLNKYFYLMNHLDIYCCIVKKYNQFMKSSKQVKEIISTFWKNCQDNLVKLSGQFVKIIKTILQKHQHVF
jgi:hypothetical protein